MNRTVSALVLVLLGFAGGLFFWLTDPSIGVATHVMDAGINRIDAAHQAMLGTIIGLAGSCLAVMVGLWNMLRGV